MFNGFLTVRGSAPKVRTFFGVSPPPDANQERTGLRAEFIAERRRWPNREVLPVKQLFTWIF
jgi:hypothetical protein